MACSAGVDEDAGSAAQWQQQEEDILERLLARSATEAVRWTGAGRLCGRGRGRSTGEAVVSTVPRRVVNPNLLRASPDWTPTRTSSAGLPLDGLQQSMLAAQRPARQTELTHPGAAAYDAGPAGSAAAPGRRSATWRRDWTSKRRAWVLPESLSRRSLAGSWQQTGRW